MSVSVSIPEQKNNSEINGNGVLSPVFHFWNGDEYTGEYAILKEKQKLIMEGHGEYRTSDGHTYEGVWNDDILIDNCKITYPDRSVFTGYLEDMVMQGPGKYIFKEEVSIEGEFLNNCFVGKVFLKDPNGHSWQSVSEEGDVLMFFRPLHPFWQSVLHRPFPNDQLFYGEADEEMENSW